MNIKNVTQYVLILSVTCLTGCASVHTIYGSTSTCYSTTSINIDDPYKLTQDCSNWSGADREIEINNYDINVAGSTDGKVILVMDAHQMKNRFHLIPFLFNAPKHSYAVNRGAEIVIGKLREHEIEAVKIEPIRAFGNIDGYFITCSDDAYSILKKYTKH